MKLLQKKIIFNIQINQLQAKLRNNVCSNQDGFHVLKAELKARDDSIYKLRQDILTLQEKRDLTLSEVKYLIFLIETNYE